MLGTIQRVPEFAECLHHELAVVNLLKDVMLLPEAVD
jgi:hypothetical protein